LNQEVSQTWVEWPAYGELPDVAKADRQRAQRPRAATTGHSTGSSVRADKPGWICGRSTHVATAMPGRTWASSN
jgi:hypothetical protein